MELTDAEKKIIEAYRGGGIVSIIQPTSVVKDYEDAIERTKRFGGVDDIIDLDYFISFRNESHDCISFSVLLDK